MDVAHEHASPDRTGKYAAPPIGYLSVRRHEARKPQAVIESRQSDDEDELSGDDDSRNVQPMQHRPPSDPSPYAAGSSRDANARFARAPNNSGYVRTRTGAPGISPGESTRALPQRQDSTVAASEPSTRSARSPSGLDQSARQESIDSEFTDMPYRRPGKHRVGESPTPEEYMALPPDAKKKVDNRLSARRSRAKRKEHVHVLTAQITEQQNTIDILRIENKQLNDHIANLSRAGYSLHPPPFQPGLVPHHPHPSPHLRHAPIPPSDAHPSGRHLPPVRHSTLPSPRRSHSIASPTVSAHLSMASGASGLVAAAAPPTGPGHVPILASGARSEASGSFAGQGQSGMYDSPGRSAKREIEDDRDDRLRTRTRYASPEGSNWGRESEGRRMSHSGYRSPSRHVEHYSRYPKQAGPTREQSRTPPPPSHARWNHLPPSLAGQSGPSQAAGYDSAEEVTDVAAPIQISGRGTVSDRLATLIRVHKRAILTYRATRQGQLTERKERMEGVLGAAEAIGKELEELTDEFRFVGQEED